VGKVYRQLTYGIELRPVYVFIRKKVKHILTGDDPQLLLQDLRFPWAYPCHIYELSFLHFPFILHLKGKNYLPHYTVVMPNVIIPHCLYGASGKPA
jgi:predicted CDP-diglyceride synthetase/phosphatidate cytidylyltransferase